MSHISRLLPLALYATSCVSYLRSSLSSLRSRLSARVSPLLSCVSRLVSPVLCLLSCVSCLVSPVSCLLSCVLCLLSCGDLSKPIDAETRRIIDSISTSAIQQARLEVDSVFKNAVITKMPQAIDSIRQIRLKEIEEQLKSIPVDGSR